MIAYLIDPIAKTVTAIEHDGSIEHIYKQLNCRLVDVLRLDHGDAIFIDDEGLDHDTAEVGLFGVTSHGIILVGRGMVIGADGEGDPTTPVISLTALASVIEFPR